MLPEAAQLADALSDMPYVVIEPAVDFAAVVQRQIPQLQQSPYVVECRV